MVSGLHPLVVGGIFPAALQRACVPGPLAGTTNRGEHPTHVSGRSCRHRVWLPWRGVTAQTTLGRCTACTIFQPFTQAPSGGTALDGTMVRPQHAPPRPGSLQVMYPGMAGRMNYYQPQSLRREGSRCKPNSPRHPESVHNVHTPLAGQRRDGVLCLARRKQPSEEDPGNHIVLVMSSTQRLAMNE